MQALERAIAEHIPVAGLSRTSPLTGLRRRRAGAVDVAAQSVAGVAPAGVALVNPGAVGSEAGPFAVVAVLATVALVGLLATTIAMFARRIASTGSLYTFTTRGLGPTAGIVGGTALALGYGATAAGCLLEVAHRMAGWLDAGGGEPSHWLLGGVLLGLFALVAAVISRGVRITTRVMLAIEVVAVLTVAAVAVVVFAASGWDFTPLVPSLGAGVDVDAVLGGVAVGLVAFIGFESGVALGPEARRPLATVPRALLWTVVAVCLSYLIGVSAQLVGSAAEPAVPAGSHVALATLGEAAGQAWISPLVDVIVVLSFLACSVALTTALVRLTFTLARERVLPEVLGRTSHRGVPAPGVAWVTGGLGAATVVPLLLGNVGDVVERTTDAASIIGFLLAYLLVAVAAPVFLLRIGEFTWTSLVPAALTAAALGATLVHYVGDVPAASLVPVSATLLLLAGVAVLLVRRVRRSPDTAARLGLYDSPVAADSIGGLPVPERADGP